MADPVDEIIQEALNKLGTTIPNSKKKEIEQIAQKIVNEGIPPNQALNITEDDEKAMYNHAYKLFQNGRYKQARGLFFFLRTLNPGFYHYSFAIAACCQKLNEYSDAGANYIVCTHIDPLNPVPYFQLYHCFSKLNQPLPALHSILTAIECAKLDPVYAPLEARAKLELAHLQSVLKQQGEEENKKVK